MADQGFQATLLHVFTKQTFLEVYFAGQVLMETCWWKSGGKYSVETCSWNIFVRMGGDQLTGRRVALTVGDELTGMGTDF